VDISTLVEAEDRQKRETVQRQVARDALTLAEERFDRLIRRKARIIIVDHLRPALEETMESARAPAGLLRGRDLSPASLLDADEGTREAFFAVRALSDRYRGLRRAQTGLLGVLEAAVGGPERHFGEFENFVDVWPDFDGVQFAIRPGEVQPRAPTSPPWPEDPVERFLWIVNSRARPWIPLPEELRAAIAAHEKARRDEAARARGLSEAPVEVMTPYETPA
jgi:hypothetical protein